jgi:hypothetical protein
MHPCNPDEDVSIWKGFAPHGKTLAIPSNMAWTTEQKRAARRAAKVEGTRKPMVVVAKGKFMGSPFFLSLPEWLVASIFPSSPHKTDTLSVGPESGAAGPAADYPLGGVGGVTQADPDPIHSLGTDSIDVFKGFE